MYLGDKICGRPEARWILLVLICISVRRNIKGDRADKWLPTELVGFKDERY